VPGIPVAGVEELLDNDAETVILTRGMELAADLSRDSGASSGSGHPVPYGGKQRGCKDLQQACWARRICRRSIPLDLLSEPSSRSTVACVPCQMARLTTSVCHS